MKKLLLPCLLIICMPGFGQFGVSYYQSDISSAAISYEFKSGLRTELRIGTNLFLAGPDQYFYSAPYTIVMADLTYDFIKREGFEFYAGALIRASDLGQSGIAVPLGLNAYPFQDKRLGFIMELAPMYLGDQPAISGSVGLRYRFLKPEKA